MQLSDYTTPSRLAIAVVIILVIILILWLNHAYSRDAMFGLWKANEDFCVRAEIDNMMVMIGPDLSWRPGYQRRHCFLLMHADSIVIAHKLFVLEVYGGLLGKLRPWVPREITRSVRLTEREADDDLPDTADGIPLEQIMPSELTMDWSTVDGRLVWRDDEKVYAELYRDNEASAYVEPW